MSIWLIGDKNQCTEIPNFGYMHLRNETLTILKGFTYYLERKTTQCVQPEVGNL